MCGIAGLVRFDGRPVLETDVRSMCRVMVHRGPDEEGVYLGAGVGLGMRRLSIIDLDGGQQPVSNEDGSVWVVFNGEIYNYRELRRMLDAARPRAPHRRATPRRSSISTRTSGRSCVDHLRGMFAFAIWDATAPAAAAGARPAGHQAAVLRGARRRHRLRVGAEADPAAARGEPEPELGSARPSVHVPGDAAVAEHRRRRAQARTRRGSPRRRAGRPLRIDRYWDVDFTPDERATEGRAG